MVENVNKCHYKSMIILLNLNSVVYYYQGRWLLGKADWPSNMSFKIMSCQILTTIDINTYIAWSLEA